MLGTRMFLRRGGCPRCRDGRVGDGDGMGERFGKGTGEVKFR